MNELKHVCNMFLIRELVKVTLGEVKVKAKKKKKWRPKQRTSPRYCYGRQGT